MKEVATLTIRQDPDEPQLQMRIYRDKLEHFYACVESDHPAIPTSMPMLIEATNFKDAKCKAEKLLRLIRGVFRQALGKTADLPDNMKEVESEVPAFLNFLLTKSCLGQN